MRRTAATSARAATVSKPCHATGRAMIRKVLQRRTRGLTRQALADLTGLPLQTVCPRVRELLDSGELEVCGKQERGKLRYELVRLK